LYNIFERENQEDDKGIPGLNNKRVNVHRRKINSAESDSDSSDDEREEDKKEEDDYDHNKFFEEMM